MIITIFSYWLFVWFVLFYVGIIKENPLLFLCIGYVIVIIEMIYLISKKTSTYNIKKFFIINIIIKLFPILIILLTSPIKINLYKDIKFGLIVILIYVIVMNILGINIKNEYLNMINSYVKDEKDKRTYISKLYDYLIQKNDK